MSEFRAILVSAVQGDPEVISHPLCLVNSGTSCGRILPIATGKASNAQHTLVAQSIYMLCIARLASGEEGEYGH